MRPDASTGVALLRALDPKGDSEAMGNASGKTKRPRVFPVHDTIGLRTRQAECAIESLLQMHMIFELEIM